MRYPGFLRTFGSRLGAGLADELLDRWFPPPLSFLQRFAQAFVDQAPMIVAMVQSHLYKNEPPPADAYSPGPSRPITPEAIARGEKIAKDYAERHGIAWAPACKTLGEFTCPKCAGHTWGTMGFDENGTYLRYCTNGLETAYGPGLDPNTVKTPCQFQWKATEDHLYFAKPSADGVRRSTETVMCVPPDKMDQRLDAIADSLLNRDWPALEKAVGDRKRDGEHLMGTAARLLTEADAFIKQQSDKITELMLDNVFPAGKGEIGFMLTDSGAKKLGVAYAPGAPPMRVSLVLDGWQWSVRLGPARIGGTLIPLDWAKAEELLRDARNASGDDQTAMAQNAAGGVA